LSSNKIRNILLLLKQYGFTNSTLETIYKNEESILDIIYNKRNPFHNKYFEIYTEKEKELSIDINPLIVFSREFISKMNEYKSRGIKVFYKYDSDYPSYLFPKGKEPLFLYSYGNLELLKENVKKVAIVGTRDSTELGIDKTRNVVNYYVERGWVTVSGLAKGIDTIVHEETINSSGRTIAVLPASFEKIYPAENLNLFNIIVSNIGLALTTTGPFENTYKSSFLDRNTIVAKMSDEIVVMEASIKSGTLNTLRQGFKFNKAIYYDNQLLDKEVIKYIQKFNAIEINKKGE